LETEKIQFTAKLWSTFEMSPCLIAAPLAGKTMGSGDDAFVVAEWKDAGGPVGPPRYIAPFHVHHEDDEAWYVLEGSLCVRSGEKVIEAGPGAGVFVPRGTPHTYWNPGTGLVRYLLIMTPSIFRLIQEIHAMEDRSRGPLEAMFRKYKSELVEMAGG
jgi:mannose-6-phosphate isomerase-like protein (cupin superfamily)